MNKAFIDLPEQDLGIVKQLLQQYVPDYEVRAFGSRVKHNAKKFSDLDLVIMTKVPINLSILADLAEAFSNSKLPIKVDLLDWSRLDEGFQKLIANHSVVIQQGLSL